MQVRRFNANVGGIHGLTYVPDYLSRDEEADLLYMVDKQPWSNELRRRVQHYGYRYDYKRRHAGRDSYIGRLPGWLLALAERLHYDGFIDTIPDQSAINEYQPGQGISTHIDCAPCFDDTVLILSLGSPCVMEFSRPDVDFDVPVLLDPRSLLVMTDTARYKWKHGIAARKTDTYQGMAFPRGRRVSVTFRKILLEEVASNAVITELPQERKRASSA